MKPFVFYPDGSPVRPRDVVTWRDEQYEVLALWIDRDDDTNVSLFQPGYSSEDGIRWTGSRNWRANSRDLTFIEGRLQPQIGDIVDIDPDGPVYYEGQDEV